MNLNWRGKTLVFICFGFGRWILTTPISRWGSHFVHLRMESWWLVIAGEMLKWLDPEVKQWITIWSWHKQINKWWRDGEKEENSPISSTMSGGKTREAKARRKMSENSLSRPPMPIFSKFQSGLMMDGRDSRVLAFPGGGQTEKDSLMFFGYLLKKHLYLLLCVEQLFIDTSETAAGVILSRKWSIAVKLLWFIR